MKKILLMQFIFALLISSALAFSGLAQYANASYGFEQGKDRERQKEKPKDPPKKDEKQPKNDKKDDKKKP